MNYLGDFAEDESVYIPFNTFSSDDPAASVTITNLADADIKVHKDGSATEIVTDGATVAIDFDSITGNHLITIDTSADAAYSTGSDYLVRVEGTTVDGATINAWVGSFSIENRFMRGTNSANTTTPPTVAAIRSEMDSNSTQLAAIVADTNELQTDDVPGLIAALNNISTAQVNSECDTAISDAGLATAANLATVDGIVDAILVDTDTTIPALIAALNNISSADVNAACDTAISDASLATSASLATVDSNVDAILVDTQDIQSRIPAALVSGRMSSDAVAISGSTTAADRLETSALTIVSGTAQTGTLSTTVMTSDLSEATDDHYNGRILIWTSGVLVNQATDITDYSGTNGTLTFTAVTEAPSNGDTFIII